MSYAEDETEVEGTVNGVTATTTGKREIPHPAYFSCIPLVLHAQSTRILEEQLFNWNLAHTELILSRWGQHS